MDRIDPQRLIANYRKAKKKPIRGDFVNKKGDGCCALGVTALCELRPQGIQVDRYNVGFLARERLGLNPLYFEGFVCGWDDQRDVSESDDPKFIMGVSDGRSCWESVCGEGMVSE